MIFRSGEKVHVVIRRKFESDIRRHFVGEIEENSSFSTSARIRGYVFIFDTTANHFVKKPEERTTIMDLAESGYTVNILHPDVEISQLKYLVNEQKRLVVTDGKRFSLDVNEFGFNR